jgi:hypothetical protein
LLVDCFEQAFDGYLQQLILNGRYSQRTGLSIFFWNENPPHEFCSVAFLFQVFHQLVNILIEILLILFGGHTVNTARGVLADELPTVFEHFLVEHPE